MNILIKIVAIVGGIYIVLRLGEFCIAMYYELKGSYKKACFNYMVGYIPIISRLRIKYLWRKYGPFDYSDRAETLEKESKNIGKRSDNPYDDCHTACLNAEAMRIREIYWKIRKTVAAKKDQKI